MYSAAIVLAHLDRSPTVSFFVNKRFLVLMGSKRLRFFIWVFSTLCLVCFCNGFDPVDNYLIDCGSTKKITVGSRVFVPDDSSSKLLSSPGNVLASTSKSVSSFDDSILYQTARIFTGTSKYTFSIGQRGRHWIRLYFYPFVFESYDMSKASFAVSTQNLVLLNKFTASSKPVVKEFSVNVSSDSLVITFTPDQESFAFVNALEVVSVPDELIQEGANTINPKAVFPGLVDQALETIWRVNMGGSLVSFENDTLGRTWVPDNSFLHQANFAKSVSNTAAVKYVLGGSTRNIAPPSVYGTATEMNTSGDPNSNFNVTWDFDVEPGFQYLVRFHICDIVSKALNELYFNVYIDSWLVAPDLDTSTQLANTLGAAFHLDFVTGPTVKDKMRISVGPSDIHSGDPNAILNGLEIMKMNNSAASLSASDAIIISSGSGSKNKVGLIVGLCVAGLVVLVLVGIIAFLFVRRRQLASQGHSKTWVPLSIGGSYTMGSKYSNGTATSIASNVSYRFPFAAVQEATNNFDESWVIGIGGFGKVYKGVFNDGTKVAVKRGNPRSQQGIAEFRTEIEMLSHFRHRHLVSLIGYCDEKNEMILVYEYMENGTLKSHLYGSGFPSLDWKQRLEICIGAARGLHYLHTGSAKAIIHRDVKSANILLDENFLAKVADFGLSKAGPELDQTHVSTAVKGSFGYLDPEYFRRQQLTEKSDVYSFGVVLFEVICARPVIDPTLPRDKVNLAEWAIKWQKKGQLDQIIDPNLAGKVRPDSLRKFSETAEKCLAEYGVDRPSMGDVLWNLEYALQLQEAVAQGDPEENSTNMIGELSPQVNNFNESDTSVSATQFEMVSADDLSGVSMSKVFSQLVKSEGR